MTIISCSTTKKDLTEDEILLDSLKWLFYAINYGAEVRSENPDDPRLNVFQCGIKLLRTDTMNDSIRYTFDFFSPRSSYNYLPTMGFSGIGVVKDKFIYPIGWHFRLDINSYPDSCNIFFRRISKEFGDSLKLYNGEIDPWLKAEAKRRRILN